MTKRQILMKRQTPAQTHCMHGYSEKYRTCLTCHHDPGECDWGACHQPGTDYKRLAADGRHLYTRSLCQEHHAAVTQLDGRLVQAS